MIDPKSLKMNKFVEDIVKDPASPPETVLLSGLIGRSSVEGHTRLYFDLQLSDYVEIPTEAILHVVEAGEGPDAFQFSYVWIERGTAIKSGRSQASGAFLQGAIADAHMAEAEQAAGLLGGGGPTTLLPQFCPTYHLPTCTLVTSAPHLCPLRADGTPVVQGGGPPLHSFFPVCPPTRPPAPACIPNTVHPPCLPRR